MADATYYPQGCCPGELMQTPFRVTVDAVAGEVSGVDMAAVVARIVAAGFTYPAEAGAPAVPVTAAALLSQFDIELKPIGGHASADGVFGNESVSTTADAKFDYPKGGGNFRDLDPGGDEHQENPEFTALNDFALNVKAGSIAVISGVVFEQVIV